MNLTNNINFTYPNPFNSSVKITVFGIAGNSDLSEGKQCEEMTLNVYDLRGNLVYDDCRRGLPNSNTPNTSIDNSSENRHREMSPTEYQFIWAPDKSISSGIYLVRIALEDYNITKRILYLK